jgi:hypothetical protein
MLTTEPGPGIEPYHDQQIGALPPEQGVDWLRLSRPQKEMLTHLGALPKVIVGPAMSRSLRPRPGYAARRFFRFGAERLTEVFEPPFAFVRGSLPASRLWRNTLIKLTTLLLGVSISGS